MIITVILMWRDKGSVSMIKFQYLEVVQQYCAVNLVAVEQLPLKLAPTA
jgi:hypothetical protein